MNVIINKKHYTWESNFLVEINNIGQTTWFKKREDYYCSDIIGGTKCFIKRSEIGFDGTSLFAHLIGINSIAIPQTYALEEVVENNKKVQYLITEFIEGDTLDIYISKSLDVFNLDSFIGDLLKSIHFLHSLGYWHPDFNSDNILISSLGKVYLIDIDSCVPCSIRPTHISNSPGALTTFSNQLGSYVLKYYKNYLNKDISFDFSEIPGSSFNYFQLLFLTCQIKKFKKLKEIDPNLIWKKSTFRKLKIEEQVFKQSHELVKTYFTLGLEVDLNHEQASILVKGVIDDFSSTASAINITHPPVKAPNTQSVNSNPPLITSPSTPVTTTKSLKWKKLLYIGLSVLLACSLSIGYFLYNHSIVNNSEPYISQMVGVYANNESLQTVEILNYQMDSDGQIVVSGNLNADKSFRGELVPNDSLLYLTIDQNLIQFKIKFERGVPYLSSMDNLQYKKIF